MKTPLRPPLPDPFLFPAAPPSPRQIEERGGGAAATAIPGGDKEQVLPTIDADQVHALLSSGHGYIDVRMQEDFDKGHAPGARNVPYYLSVTPQGKEKNPRFIEEVAALFGKDGGFIVGCNTGNRSRFATADLLNAGFKNARNLQGGYRSFLQSANQQSAQQP